MAQNVKNLLVQRFKTHKQCCKCIKETKKKNQKRAANSVDVNVTYCHTGGVSAKPAAPRTLPNPLAPREVLAYHMRRLRVERGWSQEKLAFECDLDRTYVSAVERCVWNVSLANIERIAKALDVHAWQLICPPAPLDER